MSTGGMFDEMQGAYGDIADDMFPDRITIQRPVTVKGPTGGSKDGVPSVLVADVPTRYKPASGYQKTLAEKPVSGTAYMFVIPSRYNDAFVSISGSCDLVVAERDAGEPSRTFHVDWIGRLHGTRIGVLASIQE